MSGNHARLTKLVDLLPSSRADLARKLGVSPATLHGWLRVGRGEQLHKRAPGFATPSAAVLARATELLRGHVGECQAALARGLDGELGYVGPFWHGPDLDAGEDSA